MVALSDVSVRVLTEAGWSPGRRVRLPSAVTATLQAAGHSIHPVAQDFLEEFHGLHLWYPHARVPGDTDDCIIDPMRAATELDAGWFRDYERRTGEAVLTPLGQASGGYLALSMGDSGAVYVGYDDFLARVGPSGYAAINALVGGEGLAEIR